MNKVSKIISSIIESCLRNISGGLGRWMRYHYYKRRLGGCGKNVVFDIGVNIQSPKSVFLADNVWLDNYVIIIAGSANPKNKIKFKENASYQYKIGELHIGKGVHIAPLSVLQTHGGMSIGENTGVASGSKLYTLSHHYRNLNDPNDNGPFYFTPMINSKHQFLISSPIVIGEGCAVGLNCVVLPGTTIPNGTWVGVNTTISGQDLIPNAIYGSDKGKFIKHKSSLK